MKNRFKTLKLSLLINVFNNIFIAIVIAVVSLLALFTIFRNPFFALLEFICLDILRMSRFGMESFYSNFLVPNQFILILIFISCLVVTFLYRALSKVSTYLEHVETSLNTITDDNAVVKPLPAELDPIHQKLIEIKSTLKDREIEAKEAEQKKNDLIVYLAHDLKTPLTSIIGYLTLLENEKDISIDLREKYTHIALDKALRLEELTNEFFEITRFNLQSIPLDKQNINLTILLSQLTEELFPMMAERNLNIINKLDDQVFVLGDGNKLARVFINILKNAIHYSYENTNIELYLTSNQNYVTIQITNHGATIPQHQIDHLFDKFFRGDASRSSTTGGAGLGLAIAKEIIDLHFGKISVKSESEQTTFTIQLLK